jgi:hypothetical protein
VRADVFLCMLADDVEWKMRQALAPILFDDHDRAAAVQSQSLRRNRGKVLTKLKFPF